VSAASRSPDQPDPIPHGFPAEALLTAAYDKLKADADPAIEELAEEVDDVRRRYLAQRG